VPDRHGDSFRIGFGFGSVEATIAAGWPDVAGGDVSAGAGVAAAGVAVAAAAVAVAVPSGSPADRASCRRWSCWRAWPAVAGLPVAAAPRPSRCNSG